MCNRARAGLNRVLYIYSTEFQKTDNGRAGFELGVLDTGLHSMSRGADSIPERKPKQGNLRHKLLEVRRVITGKPPQ